MPHGKLWTLWAVMRQLQAAKLFTSINTLFFLSDDWVINPLRGAVEFDKPAESKKWLDLLQLECIELGLKASVNTIFKLQDVLSKTPISFGEVRSLAAELHGRLIDEMKETFVLTLSVSEAEHYKNPRKDWEKIIDRFPDVVNDIEEARKCFALARYTGAVFHSLQIIEAGLTELGKFINVPDPKSGWTAVTKELKKIVDKKYNDQTKFEKDNFDFLEQVQGTAEALKNAWRNKISHAQGRLILLSTEFTPEIAEEILFATRAFMRRLAEGLAKT
jgi:hypothetical protein